jgi:hypothetical protein
MALENPITSDDLTIDFATLLDLSVSNRVQAAASDNTFAQALIASLTPIQMAKAFPDYYRKQLPDISNFILANRYLDETGKGAFDQQGGGDPGEDKAFYDGETAVPAGQNPAGVPEVTAEQMREKLLEKGIDVNGILEFIGSEGKLLSDPNLTHLNDLTPEQLSKAGLEVSATDEGKKVIRTTAIPEMTDEQAVASMREQAAKAQTGVVAPGSLADTLQSGEVFGSVKAAGKAYQSYNKGAAHGYKAGTMDLEKTPLSEVMRLQNLPKNHPDKLFAVGAYQVIPDTMKAAVTALGLDPDKTTYDAATQTKIMAWLTTEKPGRKGIGDFIRGDSDDILKAQEQMSQEWASMASVSKGGKSYYSDGVNKAKISLEQTRAALEDAKKRYKENIALGMDPQIAYESALTGVTSQAVDPEKQFTPEEISKHKVEVAEKKKLDRENSLVESVYDKQISPTSIEANPTPAAVPADLEQAISEMPKKVQVNLKSDPTSIKALETAKKLGTDEDVQRLVADAATGKINPNSSIVQKALEFKGMHEKRDRETLTKFLNGDPVGSSRAWCAAFVNASLKSQGIKGTESWAAGDFSNYGDQVGDPKNVKAGDIIVNKQKSPRTGKIGSHVMIATGPAYKDKNGKWMIPTISGNTTDKKSHEGDTVAEYPVAFDTMNVRTVPQEKEYYTEDGWQNLQAKLEQNELRQQALDQDQQINDQANVPVAAATPVAGPTTVLNTNPEQNFTTPSPNSIDSKPAEKPPESKSEKPVPVAPEKPQESQKPLPAKTAEPLLVKKEDPKKIATAEIASENNDSTLSNAETIAAKEAPAPGRAETTPTAATPEPIVYDGRRELFQTPEASEAVVGEQPAIAKLSKPSVIPPGTNKHQADMGNVTNGGPFQPAEEAPVAPTPIQTAEVTSTIKTPESTTPAVETLTPAKPTNHVAGRDAPAPIQTAEAAPVIEKTAPITTTVAAPKPQVETPAAPATPKAEAPAPIKSAEATPAPIQVAEAIPAPTGRPEEVRKFRTGGSPDVQDDENLSVFDEDGSLKWKMNSGEGIYVKPKDTEYADDKIDELAGRVDDIDQRNDTPEKNQPKAAPDKDGGRPEKNWQQNASSVTYSIGSQGRAFKRTKFQNEGFHFNRSAPNSTSS